MNDSRRWYRIVATAPHAEDEAHRLLKLGANGVETITSSSIAGSFHWVPTEIPSLYKNIQRLGFVVASVAEVEIENWVQKCEDSFQPVTVGKLLITPIMDSSDPRRPTAHEIFVVPGFGFGTGHHPTTRMILTLMQDARINTSLISSVADIGTGSGILSAAASLLFPTTKIHAIDNDELALVSAQTTFSLNPPMRVPGKLEIELGSFDKLRGHYDLILANLYEEVIRFGALSLATHAKPQSGLVLLSGFFTSQEPTIIELFPESTWQSLERTEIEGWVGRMFRKR